MKIFIVIPFLFLISCSQSNDAVSSSKGSFYSEDETSHEKNDDGSNNRNDHTSDHGTSSQEDDYTKDSYTFKDHQEAPNVVKEEPKDSISEFILKYREITWHIDTMRNYNMYPKEVPKEFHNLPDIQNGSDIRIKDFPIELILKNNQEKFYRGNESIYGYKTHLSKEDATKNFKSFCYAVRSDFIQSENGGYCNTHEYIDYFLEFPYVYERKISDTLVERDAIRRDAIREDRKKPRQCPSLAKPYPITTEEDHHVKRDFKDARLNDFLTANCRYLVSAIGLHSLILAVENIEDYLNDVAHFEKKHKYERDHSFITSDITSGPELYMGTEVNNGKKAYKYCRDPSRMFDYFIIVSNLSEGYRIDEESEKLVRSPFYRENLLTTQLVELVEHMISYSTSTSSYDFKPREGMFFDHGDKCHVRFLPW